MIKPIRNKKLIPFMTFTNKKEIFSLIILFTQLVIVTQIIYIIFL